MKRTTIYPTIQQIIATFGLWILLSAGFRFFAFNMFFYETLLAFVKGYLEILSGIFGVIYHEFPSSDNLIALNGASLKIIYECTAYSYYLFIFAIVLFSPWKWHQKLWGGTTLLVLTTLLNALRFFSVAWVVRIHPDKLDVFHDYVWNILFAVVVFVMYFVMHYLFIRKNQKTQTV